MDKNTIHVLERRIYVRVDLVWFIPKAYGKGNGAHRTPNPKGFCTHRFQPSNFF